MCVMMQTWAPAFMAFYAHGWIMIQWCALETLDTMKTQLWQVVDKWNWTALMAFILSLFCCFQMAFMRFWSNTAVYYSSPQGRDTQLMLPCAPVESSKLVEWVWLVAGQTFCDGHKCFTIILLHRCFFWRSNFCSPKVLFNFETFTLLHIIKAMKMKNLLGLKGLFYIFNNSVRRNRDFFYS